MHDPVYGGFERTAETGQIIHDTMNEVVFTLGYEGGGWQSYNDATDQRDRLRALVARLEKEAADA